MPEDEQYNLIREAVTKHFVHWAYLEAGECRLALGEKFRLVVERIVRTRDIQVGIFEKYFSGLDENSLLAAVGGSKVDGFGLIEGEIEKLRSAANKAFGTLNKYFLIAIGVYPDLSADYKMWGLRDSFESKELMWLSMGFEPTENLNTDLMRFKNGSRDLDTVVGKEALKRLDIINRSETLSMYGHRSADGSRALEWLNSIEL